MNYNEKGSHLQFSELHQKMMGGLMRVKLKVFYIGEAIGILIFLPIIKIN